MQNPTSCRAIDCTHIKILAPPNEHKADYFSRKQCYTINTQAVIGGNLRFLDIANGFPGSLHDARVLENTSLLRKGS